MGTKDLAVNMTAMGLMPRAKNLEPRAACL